MNNVVIFGRLVKTPEISNASVSLCRFTLAVDRYSKDGNTVDFINCIAFSKRAETIVKYCEKGQLLGIRGNIKTGSYEKDGIKKYTTDIIVEEIQFAAKSNNTENNTKKESNVYENEYEKIEDDYDEVPF